MASICLGLTVFTKGHNPIFMRSSKDLRKFLMEVQMESPVWQDNELNKDHKENRNLQILILQRWEFICWYILYEWSCLIHGTNMGWGQTDFKILNFGSL